MNRTDRSLTKDGNCTGTPRDRVELRQGEHCRLAGGVDIVVSGFGARYSSRAVVLAISAPRGVAVARSELPPRIQEDIRQRAKERSGGGWLALGRRVGESLRIGDALLVTVLCLTGYSARLAIVCAQPTHQNSEAPS